MVPPRNIPPPPPETTPQERLDALRRKADQADGLLTAASEPASPPAPTLPAAISAPIPDQPGASPGQKVWMGLGLALLTGLGTLPLLAILWVLGATLGVVITAEALERTRGLAPSTAVLLDARAVAPRRGPGVVLVMRFARVEGMSGMFGTKRIVLEGQMLKDGNVAADFIAMRYKSVFGRSRGFQTTCGIMEDVVEELAEDVGKWLYKPTMHAQLGDLSSP